MRRRSRCGRRCACRSGARSVLHRCASIWSACWAMARVRRTSGCGSRACWMRCRCSTRRSRRASCLTAPFARFAGRDLDDRGRLGRCMSRQEPAPDRGAGGAARGRRSARLASAAGAAEVRRAARADRGRVRAVARGAPADPEDHDLEHGGHQVFAAMCAQTIEGDAGGDSKQAETRRGRARYQIAVTICKCASRAGSRRRAARSRSSPRMSRAPSATHSASASLDGAARTRDAGDSAEDAAFVLRRDGDRCTVPGCRASRYIEVHHIEHRANGGDHRPENLTSLCGGHHDAHHRGALRISGRAPNLTFEMYVALEPEARQSDPESVEMTDALEPQDRAHVDWADVEAWTDGASP